MAGVFYAEIVRDGFGQPYQLYPLNPAKMRPVAGEGPKGSLIKGYEFQDGAKKVFLPAENVVARRNLDLTNPYGGL